MSGCRFLPLSILRAAPLLAACLLPGGPLRAQVLSGLLSDDAAPADVTGAASQPDSHPRNPRGPSRTPRPRRLPSQRGCRGSATSAASLRARSRELSRHLLLECPQPRLPGVENPDLARPIKPDMVNYGNLGELKPPRPLLGRLANFQFFTVAASRMRISRRAPFSSNSIPWHGLVLADDNFNRSETDRKSATVPPQANLQ